MLALLAIGASGHPLGNFTINHYAALEVQPDGLAITYILDMAEIPTFQEVGGLDDARTQRQLSQRLSEWIRGLEVTADGTRVPLALTGTRIACLAGVGGLPTLRIEADLWAGRTAGLSSPAESRAIQFSYRDTNFPARIGWKEIVVTGERLLSSTAPRTDLGSNRLRTYPTDLLNSPPNDLTARFTAQLAGTPPGTHPREVTPRPVLIFDLLACHRERQATTDASGSSPRGPRSQTKEVSAFAGLFARLAQGHPTPQLVIGALLGAFVLGAYHSLTPGHGKTILAAYFVGSRGTPGQAVLLGVTTTLTHTTGVFLLGLGTLFASRYVVAEQLYPWLSVLSGAMLMGMGVSLFRRRLRASRTTRSGGGGRQDGANPHAHDNSHPHGHAKGQHRHDHVHPHGHGHAHAHNHHPLIPGDRVRARDLITLGITGGLLPCPSALVVMLAAISVGQVGFGLVLITAFSIGLAAVLTGGGMLMVYSRTFMTRLIQGAEPQHHPSRWRAIAGPILQRLPMVSAAAVAVLGSAIIIQTLAATGLVR